MRIQFKMKTTKEAILKAHKNLVVQYKDRDSSFTGWHPELREENGVWSWVTWTSSFSYTTRDFVNWEYTGAENGFMSSDWWHEQGGRETVDSVCGTYGTFTGANSLSAYGHQKRRFVAWFETNRHKGGPEWYVIQAKAAKAYRNGMRSPFCSIERLARSKNDLLRIAELTHESPSITFRRMSAEGLRIR